MDEDNFNFDQYVNEQSRYSNDGMDLFDEDVAFEDDRW